MNKYDQAMFHINRAKVRSFHFKATTAYNQRKISNELYQEVIDRFCQKFDMTIDEYSEYL